MSAAKKKPGKPVKQEELRRLMREQQRHSAEKKRVESPYARYNALGQLSCAVCAAPVKSERLWTTHVLGRTHKERVAEIKAGKEVPEKPQCLPGKRKASDGDGGKRMRLETETPVGSSAGLSLLAGVYEDDDEEEEEKEAGGLDIPTASQQPEAGGLPADFFDSSVPSAPTSVSHSGSVLKAAAAAGGPEKSPERKENTAEALPEGFFDDPVRDAKVRKVEAPQDQMDREWEEFQKEMRQVSSKSEAIVAEEDEEGRLERQIDEIDQQMECYRRVEQLRDRREAVKSEPAVRAGAQLLEEKEEEEEEDEEELLALLFQDWRAKGALA